MIILVGQLAYRNHHEVHCCDCIRMEKQKFELQLKEVKTSKGNGRSKIVHLPLSLAGFMHALIITKMYSCLNSHDADKKEVLSWHKAKYFFEFSPFLCNTGIFFVIKYTLFLLK